MNYGEIKNASLKLADEYSSRGAIQAATKIADMALKIQDLISDSVYDLASTVAKIPAVQIIDRTDPSTLTENALSDDFLSLNYVSCKLSSGEYKETSNYQITPTKQIVLPNSGYIYHIFYWKKPNQLVFTGDAVTDDAQTLEIVEEAQRIIPYYVAAELMGSEGNNERMTTLSIQYESKKKKIIGSRQSYMRPIIDVYKGW